MLIKIRTKGQTTVEYGALVLTIVIALTVMATGYIKRAVCARMEQLRRDLNDTVR